MKLTMIKAFLIAWWQFMKRDCDTMPREARTVRLNKCLSCAELKDKRCFICGCWVHLKTWCIDEECPRWKW